MEIQPVVSRVIELFDSTCVKQFESMGCEISQMDAPSGSPDMASSYIDAANDDLSVKLLIHSAYSLLEHTMPSDVLEWTKNLELQEDWNSELANRFVCRLKNKLISHDCNLKMGLPTICSRDQAEKYLEGEGQKCARFFKVAHPETDDVIECSLLIELRNKGLSLSDYEDEDEDWFSESDLEHL